MACLAYENFAFCDLIMPNFGPIKVLMFEYMIGGLSLETSLICILLSASRDVHFEKRMICFLSGLL